MDNAKHIEEGQYGGKGLAHQARYRSMGDPQTLWSAVPMIRSNIVALILSPLSTRVVVASSRRLCVVSKKK